MWLHCFGLNTLSDQTVVVQFNKVMGISIVTISSPSEYIIMSLYLMELQGHCISQRLELFTEIQLYL